MKYIRISPSGHKRALHSLILQFIEIIKRYEDQNVLDIIPFMDLSNKYTGFHPKKDVKFLSNPCNVCQIRK